MGKYQVPVSLLKYHIKSEMLYATSHIHERIPKHSLLPSLLLQSLKTTCEANVVACAYNLITWESEWGKMIIMNWRLIWIPSEAEARLRYRTIPCLSPLDHPPLTLKILFATTIFFFYYKPFNSYIILLNHNNLQGNFLYMIS